MKNDQNIKKDINSDFSTVLNINFLNISNRVLIHKYISKYLNVDQKEKASETAIIFTPNPEHLVLAVQNPQFQSALEQSTLNLPDGVGVVVASKMLSLFGKTTPITERLSGVDLVQLLVQNFPKTTCAWIGGKAKKNVLKEESVIVSGQEHPWLAGYQDVDQPTAEEEAAVRAFIQKVQPEVLFVAFGAPRQEYWTLRHRAFLSAVGVKLVVVVGGSIDIFTGKLQRPPSWVRKIGLEWLYRLIQEPWRWKRQLSLLTFIRLVFRELFFS